MTSSGERARFIVVEGIDGAGTTTQARRLVQKFRERGLPAFATCEPSDGPIGALIRAALEKRLPEIGPGTPRRFDSATLALLFAADRLDHVASVVLPQLEARTTVVSDRYTLSSLVYQSVTSDAPSSALAWLQTLNREAPIPDLTIVLDVPVELAAERRLARGGPEELFDALALQRRLASAYARAEELCPRERIVHISGVGDVDAITARLLAAIIETLPELASL